ncbi:MAG: PQQ-binding-like beta-propeller repeat protein [Gemmataceae bacterium]
MWCRVPLTALSLFAVCAAGLAQDAAPSPLIGEEKRTADELDSTKKLVEAKKWPEALRRYQQILTDSGDLFVPLDGRRSLPARWLVHQQLARLDPAALKLYREQADAVAKPLLERGVTQRDVKALERVISDWFCSRPAEPALHLLGDLALERGEFEAAARYWRMIARPAAESEKPAFELVYPDPSDGGALARAKQVLALLFEGQKERAKSELTAFRTKHPGATGSLAGRRGNYAEILQKLLETDLRLGSAPVAAQAQPWTTLAGDPARNDRVATEALPYFRETPTWRTDFPGDPKGKPHRDSDPPAGTGAASRGLAFMPAVVSGHVLVADAARVTVFSLLSGEVESTYDHGTKNQLPDSLDLRVPSRTDARYTLTVVDNRVYARLGAQPMKPATDAGKPQEMDSAVVCLALERDDKGNTKLRFRWQIRARMLDSEAPALFEGTPVVRDGRLFVARTRFEGRQAITSIECYDADAPEGRDEPPPARWKQDLWSVEPTSEPIRHRHDLLTLAGPFVVYCTHSGAIIALDVGSGKRAWAYRYPPAANHPSEGLLPHDLTPCLFANGRVYAAPADSDRILCLDAMSGELIWESQPTQVVQLLGVSGGRLFATLGGYPQGVRCYDAIRGIPVWTRPDEGDLATYGRGFLTDRWLFWPTRRGLRVLQQEDGEPLAATSNPEPWGNLAFGDGCLVVATATQLWGFVPDRLLLGHWETEVNQDPGNVVARYRLALARVEAGQEDAALADFRQLEQLPDDDFFFGASVRELARHRRHEILLSRAEQAWRRNKTLDLSTLLHEAAGESFAPADRVRALALLKAVGKPESPETLDDKLRALWVMQSDGLPLRADDFLAGHPPEPREGGPKQRTPDPPLVDVAPEIPSRVEPSWTVATEPFRDWPLRPMPTARGTSLDADEEGRGFFCNGRQIVCRALATGKTLWTADVNHPADTFALQADTLIVAGERDISRLRRFDGSVLWTVHSPAPEPMPERIEQPFRRLIPPIESPPFSAFRLAGSRLFCRFGHQWLLALEADAGRVLWQFQAPGAPLTDTAIGNHFLVTNDFVLLQTTAGQLHCLEAATGRPLYRKSALATWRCDPLLLDAGGALTATDAEHLVALDLATGNVRWQQSLRGWPSLSGAAPQIRRDGSHFLVLTGRNYGFELERRDLATGERNLGPIFLGTEPVDLDAVALAESAYCIPGREAVRAYSREDGRRQWEARLPLAGPWRVQAGRGGLLTYPAAALPLTDESAAYDRAGHKAAGVPTLQRYHTAAAILYYAWMRRTFPVLRLDPADGHVTARHEFPATGPRAAVLLGEKQAAVAIEGALTGLRP